MHCDGLLVPMVAMKTAKVADIQGLSLTNSQLIESYQIH